MTPERDRSTAEAESPDWHRLARTPLLGMLAAAAAVFDLGINRVAVRTLGGVLPHDQLIQLSRWGELPRNLAAICGLVALTIALVAFLRTNVHAPVRRRLSIAGFAGIFLPTTALATLLPAERTSLQIVLFATGAANVLAVLLAVTAASRPAPRGIRVGMALVAASALLSFTALVVSLVEPLAHLESGLIAAHWMRNVGEVAYLLVPLAVAVTVFPRGRTLRSRVSIVVGVLAAGTTAALMWWGYSELHSDLTVIVYGATRLELLLEALPQAYVVPIAIGFGVGCAALTSDDATHRQAGAAVLLIIAAGYAAKSPGRLLMMVLGTALLARATLVLAARAMQRQPTTRPERTRAEEPTEG